MAQNKASEAWKRISDFTKSFIHSTPRPDMQQLHADLSIVKEALQPQDPRDKIMQDLAVVIKRVNSENFFSRKTTIEVNKALTAYNKNLEQK